MRFERRGWEFKSLRVRQASFEIPRLRSGFRLRAPASLTPANRLKFKSLRVRQEDFRRGFTRIDLEIYLR